MDLFCQIKDKLADQIILQTENFYVLHDGFPVTEGHLLIIPKFHLDCYLNLDSRHKPEFLDLKEKVSKFLTENYSAPVFLEHGVAGQTITHAHLHLIPCSYSIKNTLEKTFGKMTTPKIPYLYFEKNGESFYFSPAKITAPGYLYNLYALKLERSLIGLERNKDLKNWLLKVKKKWNKYAS